MVGWSYYVYGGMTLMDFLIIEVFTMKVILTWKSGTEQTIKDIISIWESSFKGDPYYMLKDIDNGFYRMLKSDIQKIEVIR